MLVCADVVVVFLFFIFFSFFFSLSFFILSIGCFSLFFLFCCCCFALLCSALRTLYFVYRVLCILTICRSLSSSTSTNHYTFTASLYCTAVLCYELYCALVCACACAYAICLSLYITSYDSMLLCFGFLLRSRLMPFALLNVSFRLYGTESNVQNEWKNQ